jgi:nitroreductase
VNSALDGKIAVLLGRRSVRAYQDKPIDDDTMRAVLRAAMAAPSAVACDPWRFIAIRDKTMLKRVADGLPNGKMLAKAGAGLIVCGDMGAAHDHNVSYLLQDCSAAIENALLAVHALGLGAVWLGVHPREDRISHLRALFSLPESIVPVACLAIGYPAEKKEPRTRYDETNVHWERW